MKKLALFTLVSLLLLATNAFAAGSLQVSNRRVGKINFVFFAWTADASGDVSGAGSYTARGGTIYAFLADPEAGVTDLYDVTIALTWSVPTVSGTSDFDLADVLTSEGVDLSNSTNGESASLASPIGFPGGILTPTVANAGNATSGIFVLLIWEE